MTFTGFAPQVVDMLFAGVLSQPVNLDAGPFYYACIKCGDVFETSHIIAKPVCEKETG